MMNRLEAIQKIRTKLSNKDTTIGSWMQFPDSSVAEIMGQSGYDWVTIDLEHGSISVHQLPDIFRALELGGTLPLVRVAEGHPKDCKQALDAGAGGIIIPMIEDAEELNRIRDYMRWPPAGNRGVGFNRGNLYGKYFDSYFEEAQNPLLIAMIENIKAVENIEDILNVEGLDAILIGPYDLSSSMGMTAQFDNSKFIDTIENIKLKCEKNNVPCGIHIVEPSIQNLKEKIDEGYQFIAYSIDSVFLNTYSNNPII